MQIGYLKSTFTCVRDYIVLITVSCFKWSTIEIIFNRKTSCACFFSPFKFGIEESIAKL